MEEREEKFTEGKWFAEIPKNGAIHVGSAAHDICDLYLKHKDNSIESYADAEANANLISASPDMYEALKEFLMAWDNEDELETSVKKARTALSKARGEQ